MNARIAILALAMAATAPAFGAELVADLARETGLSERRVQMIVGNRTPFAEYRTSYSRSLAQFKRALGNERYERLVAGLPIELESQPGRTVSLGNRNDAASAL
jgi:tRNA 2-selenouridine synthase SelU